MIINGTSGRDNFFGSEGDDTIRGGSGGDTLAGGGGNDLLVGGDDTLYYSITQSSISSDPWVGSRSLGGGFAFDPVMGIYSEVGIGLSGGLESWLVASGTEWNLSSGGVSYAASLSLSFSSPLAPGFIEAGFTWGVSASVDTGGVGGYPPVINVYLAGNGSLALDVFRSGDSISGGDGDDIIKGLAGWDQLQGDAGNDSLYGGDGRDTLNGGAGADVLSGGSGDDIYVFESDLDTIVELVSGGSDTLRSSLLTTSLPGNVESLILIGTAVDGFGNSLSNTIEGSDGDNRLSGLSGNDMLTGGSGRDSLAGGAGNDSLSGGSGADVLRGNSGDDTYYFGVGDVVVEGVAAGYDTVISYSPSVTLAANVEHLTLSSGGVDGFGNGLDNSLEGNEQNNRLSAGDGNDQLHGFDGDDFLLGGSGSDTLIGGNGNDSLTGGDGLDSLAGEAGDDTYSVTAIGDVVVELAGQGFDTVSSTVSYTLAADVEALVLRGTGNLRGVGNADPNTLTGNSGNNLLSGLAGNDTLTGGLGADSFVFDVLPNAATNLDIVTDFQVGADKIRLDDDVFDVFTAGMPLTESQFVSGAGVVSARTAAQFIVYDTSTGALYYDFDGVGGVLPVQFAQIGVETHPALGTGDFLIVG